MRRADISITKAIGIILMVIGHSGCPKLLCEAIYQFHMPLFFIMSGMCLSERHIEDIPNFIKRKLIGIWWPYVKYGLIFLALHNVFFRLNIYSSEYGYLDGVSSLYTVQDYIRNFTKVIRMTGSEPLLGGFWFLHALFWASVISVIAFKVIKRTWIVLCLMLTITILMSILKFEVPIVWISSTTFLATTFFVIGYCIRGIKVSNYFYPVAIVAVLFGVVYIQGSMQMSETRLIIPYIIVATVATVAINKFSLFIAENYKEWSRKLIYIGNSTMTILVWHFISFKIVSLMIIAFYNLPIEMLSKFPVINGYSSRGWWVLYTIVGFFMPLALGLFLKKNIQSHTQTLRA